LGILEFLRSCGFYLTQFDVSKKSKNDRVFEKFWKLRCSTRFRALYAVLVYILILFF